MNIEAPIEEKEFSQSESILNLPLQCAVEDAATLSLADFNRKYFIPQKPVLLKGLANMHPAGQKWTTDWFKQTMGHLDIKVFDNNRKQHVYSTTVQPDFSMKFEEFLDIIASNEPSTVRMFRYDLYKQNPALKKDFSCPHIFNQGPFKNLGFMFLGGKDTDVRLHYDVDYSNVLLTQIYGRKRVILYPPDQSKFLYQVPFNTRSLADLKHPEKWPNLKYAKGYEIIQEAGDGIFMPSGYWHYNTYLTGGISVAYRKMANTPKRFIKGATFMGFTLPFDKTVNFFFSEKWFAYKEKLCKIRNQKAVEASVLKN